MTSLRRWLTTGLRLFVWLVPIALLAPIGFIAWSLVQAAPYAGNSFTQITIFFSALLLCAFALMFFASVIAGWLVRRGRPAYALVVLAVIAALLLPAGLWPGNLRECFYELVALPGAVAFVTALVGLPQLLPPIRPAAIAVVILLAVPPLFFGGSRVYVAGYYAQDCPTGPAVDLTVSGLESAHFSNSCGLPRSGNELTGCRNGSATVGLLTGDGLWFLDLGAGTLGTVTSEETPYAAPALYVGSHARYGGIYGWRGYYTVEKPCSGYIDADLNSGVTDLGGQTYLGPGPPVHVKGHWETPFA